MQRWLAVLLLWSGCSLLYETGSPAQDAAGPAGDAAPSSTRPLIAYCMSEPEPADGRYWLRDCSDSTNPVDLLFGIEDQNLVTADRAGGSDYLLFDGAADVQLASEGFPRALVERCAAQGTSLVTAWITPIGAQEGPTRIVALEDDAKMEWSFMLGVNGDKLVGRVYGGEAHDESTIPLTMNGLPEFVALAFVPPKMQLWHGESLVFESEEGTVASDVTNDVLSHRLAVGNAPVQQQRGFNGEIHPVAIYCPAPSAAAIAELAQSIPKP